MFVVIIADQINDGAIPLSPDLNLGIVLIVPAVRMEYGRMGELRFENRNLSVERECILGAVANCT